MNKKVKVILDEAPGQRERNRQNMRIPAGAPIEILNEVDLPEWLYCFDHSDYVVTVHSMVLVLRLSFRRILVRI